MFETHVISNPYQIQQQLKFLCGNRPLACQKQNQSETGMNHRIIYVRQSQLQYHNFYQQFAKIPKDDKQYVFPKNMAYFKASVKLHDIHQIEFLPKKTVRKNQIVLTIPQIKIQYKNPPSRISNVNHLIRWRFKFDFDVKQYIQLRKIDTQRIQREQNLKAIKQMMPDKNQNQLEQSGLKFGQNQKPIQTYVETIKKVKNYINLKDKMQHQQKLFKKNLQKKQHLNAEQIANFSLGDGQEDESYAIKNFWRQFNNKMDFLGRAKAKKDQTQLYEAQVQFLKEVAFFRQQAKELFKQYINFKLVGWRAQSIKFLGFEYYKGIWIKIGGKQLNLQFNAYSSLADILYVLPQIKGFKFKVPLFVLNSYKTFKGLVMMQSPFLTPQKAEVFSYKALSQQDSNIFKISQSLKFLQKVMGTKHQPIKLPKGQQINIPFGADIKVLQYTGRKDIEQQKQKDLLLEPFHYILKVSPCYPKDFKALTQMKNQLYLRPQLIFQFRDQLQLVNSDDSRLLVEAFHKSFQYNDFKNQQDLKVAKASAYMINMKIPQLIQKLNNIQILYIDSYSIKKSFEQFGINIRYLYLVKKNTQVPYLDQILKSEALARTIKKIFRQTTKDLFKYSDDFNRKLIAQDYKQFLNKVIFQQQRALIQHTIDFLNLIFGKGEQTQAMWIIINERCNKQYKISASNYPPQIKPGCLLHAVLWHCCLSIDFTSKVPLFQSQKPFKRQNFRQFIVLGDTFQYPSFQINRLARMFPNLSPAQKLQTLDKISFNILKMDLLYRSSLNADIQVTLSQMNSYKQSLRKPQRENPLHPIQITHFIANKNQPNFQKALQILDFSLPNNHPLFLSLYNEYSSLLEKDLLKKTCLLIAIRGLGQFHPKTTQLYSKLYKQGFNQFQLKALRQKNLQQCQQNCAELFQKLKYQSCLSFAISQIEERNPETIKTSAQLISYLKILSYGLYSANQTSQIQKGLRLSVQFSEVINLFKLKDMDHHEYLLRQTLKLRLAQCSKKYYLYKMVLLTLHIEQKNQGPLNKDQKGMRKPVQTKQKQLILKGIISEYYAKNNHSQWIQYIIRKVIGGFSYFNFLKDLFTNYQYHIDNYKQESFNQALGYLHLLVKLFGQQIFEKHLYQISG